MQHVLHELFKLVKKKKKLKRAICLLQKEAKLSKWELNEFEYPVFV